MGDWIWPCGWGLSEGTVLAGLVFCDGYLVVLEWLLRPLQGTVSFWPALEEDEQPASSYCFQVVVHHPIALLLSTVVFVPFYGHVLKESAEASAVSKSP